MEASRRLFLERLARLTGLAAIAAACPNAIALQPGRYPFSLGVASGSPRPDGVVLWTRLIADPLEPEFSGEAAIEVEWEVAEDERFGRIVASGQTAALKNLAHSVHIEVSGLRPGRWYWYRFMLGDAISPVGRTRTSPAPDTLAGSLRVAFASCQHWEFGSFGAHRHIAQAEPDLVLFLGDYIYEWGPYDLSHPPVPRRSDESYTLADYRARHAQYKSDPLLQASHAAAPWIVTWDDHEVANDYGADRDADLSAQFSDRRAAAYQAFYEHMPLRLPAGPGSGFDLLRVHDAYGWGRLAQFHVLDTRQYRSYQACPPAGRGGSNSVTTQCAEMAAPERTMLGKAQESWLENGLRRSGARWNILAQQTLMARHSQTPISQSEDGRFWTDGWDGYPAARDRLFDALLRTKASNPVVISGDVHTFYAADLVRDFDRPVSRSNPVVATEFCGTSVTSNSRSQARTERYVAENPHLRYGRSDRRGYALMEISARRIETHFRGLDDLAVPDSAATTLASFAVEDGKPGVRRL